ncbi:MAG: chemotaxis protein CheB [Rhodanobacter sp.]
MTSHKKMGATPVEAGSKGDKEARSRNSPNSEPRSGLIVGIGASAGGLEAFKTFFEHMPADSELAFVLVQHLAPDHTSLLAELLSKVTNMPVMDAVDGVRVEPRHVYAIPPNATLTIVDGILQVRRPAPPREHRWPINTFFTSLAEDQGDRAVCVVLAGTGSDGSKGLRAVKEQGGLALAQSGFGDEAMSGMPASAVATGLVDAVLPVAEMPARLLTYQQQMLATHQLKDADGVRGDVPEHLKTIYELLRAEIGHDFSQYKEKTLMRRIQRRMLVVQSKTVPDYIAYLQQHASEHELLFREFLIGVTEFFRDPAAYEALQAIAIPSMLGDKGNADELRVWVAGCATGEEAYSIAIALREAMPDGRGPKVKIFATDIDDLAIAHARAGHYRAPLIGISAERRERWFHQDQDDYCVVKSIREMCIFSTHSVIKDPPFSRMDLVSCRNVLIYLNNALQERLLQSFHYALRPGGFLLLGPSERLGHNARLFNEMDQKQRLYIRQEDVDAPPRHLPDARHPHRRAPTSEVSSRQADDLLDQHARQALEPWSPAYVVINASYEVLRFGGDTRRYLAPSSGAASLNLFQLLDPPLRNEVRAAVLQTFASGQRVIRNGSQLLPGRERPLRLIVEPLVAPSEEEASDKAKVQLCVVAFHELENAPDAVGPKGGDAPDSAQTRIQALEDELCGTRAQLHTAIDLHESTSEDLKSANEEYQSVNEELQSSNEELETSSEEMQSINEELQIVNNELHDKNQALNEVNNDFRNLLDSTHVATLFLDRELHIRSFTPAMTALFHLRDGDKGRPITEISPRMNYPQLTDDVSRVLQQMTVIERVLRGGDDARTFLLRMRPYVTIEKVVDGVVLTFVDITDSQRSNREHARLAAIVNSSRDAIIGLSLDDRITSWNPAAERIFTITAAQAVGQALSRLLPPHPSPEAQKFFESGSERRVQSEFEMIWQPPTGNPVPLSMSYAPVSSDDEVPRLIAGELVARDITKEHHARRHAEMMMRELNHRVKNTLATVQAIVIQTSTTTQDLSGFKENFLSRLMALAQTHTLLAKDAWNSASLREIVEHELKPYRGSDPETNRQRVQTSGDDVRVPPKQALAISMALHELTTNAAKYGALSDVHGRVVIIWATRIVEQCPWLTLQWAEHDGPAVTTPNHRGFGSRLIRDGLAYELGGETRLEFPASGVTCSIDIPLDEAS